MGIGGIMDLVIYYLGLILNNDALFQIIPLAVATVVILFYFQRYREERAGWNTYLTNSLVLLFVAVALLRYIYSIDGNGSINFIEYQAKSLSAIFILLAGMILLRFNFDHLLPERFAKYLSSPLTVNILAFAVILFVYGSHRASWNVFAALLIIVIILVALLNLLKYPLRKLFKYVEKEKKKERLKNIKEEKYEISELKRQLKEREKELKQIKLRELEREKREVIKMKKIIRK